MIKKALITLTIFLLPFNAFAATLSTADVSRVFFALHNEIVDFHTVMSLGNHSFSPPQEAVIVLSKEGTKQELLNLGLSRLPREFLISSLLRAGRITVSLIASGGYEAVKNELFTMGQQKLIEFLQRNSIRVGNGKIDLSYTAISGERVSEVLEYTILLDPQTNDVSISFYSALPIKAPLSRPSYSVLSTEWSQHRFKGEYLDHFTITFNGQIRDIKSRHFSFTERPDIKVDFSKDPFIEKEEGEEGNGGGVGFFTALKNLIANSWKAIAGATVSNNNEGTVVNLDEIEVGEKKEEEKEEIVREEKEEKPPPEEKKKEATPSPPSRVEINSATGENLERLHGIGPTYAERIIENRPYCTLDELERVPGIGPATVRKIKEQGLATVNPSPDCLKEDVIVIDNTDLMKEAWKELEELREALNNLRRIHQESKEGGEEEGEEDNEEEEKEGRVEINSATKEELTALVGVGVVTAQRIIENRPYCTLDDLLKVPGIGEVTLQNIKDQDLAFVDPPEECFVVEPPPVTEIEIEGAETVYHTNNTQRVFAANAVPEKLSLLATKSAETTTDFPLTKTVIGLVISGPDANIIVIGAETTRHHSFDNFSTEANSSNRESFSFAVTDKEDFLREIGLSLPSLINPTTQILQKEEEYHYQPPQQEAPAKDPPGESFILKKPCLIK